MVTWCKKLKELVQKNIHDKKSYIETCYRNGINPTSALTDLMNDKSLKLSEIKKDEKSK